MENFFSKHSWHTPSKKPHIRQKTKLFACFAVIKLVVYSSLASCPGSSPKECFLWKTPSPATPDTLPQGNHTLTFTHSLMSRHGLYAQGNHLAGELYKIVPNLTVNKRMPTPSDRETSKPVPRRTVLFKLACASRAANKLVVHRSLASCPGSSPKECFF